MAILLAACTNDIENDAIQTDILTLTVGDFPAFGEDAATRAIGTTDAGGKSAWEAGDQLLVSVTCQGGDPQYAVMSYNGSTWITTPTLKQTYASYTVTAWYAPAYQWSTTNDGTLALRDGEQAGLDECIMATSNSSPNITFTSREYSRLRIASTSSTQLSVSLTDFTPAGSTTSGSNNYTLTTDSKGNAYLYGTWTENSNLDVTYGSQSLVNKDNITASVANTSYVVDASFATIFPDPTKCNEIGDGSTYPYILLNGAQLNDLATNNNANKGAQYKMAADIDLSQYSSTWTPFTFSGTFDGNGHAITRFSFSGNKHPFGLFNQNNGTIKNLTIRDCNIVNNQGNANTAAIAAQNNSGGVIVNCHVVGGSISCSNAAGIVLINYGGKVIACSNSATIGGTNTAGISYMLMSNPTIIGCYNVGNLTGTGSNSNIYNSIMGSATISACYWLNNGTVTGDNGATTWEAAIDDMNNALQEAGYNYQYEMGANNLPVIKSTN